MKQFDQSQLNHVLARLKTDVALSIFYDWLVAKREDYQQTWAVNDACTPQMQGQARELLDITNRIDRAAAERGRPTQTG